MMSINLYNDEFEVGNNGQVLDIQRIKTQGSDVSNNYRIQSNSMSPYKKLNRNEAVFNDSINPNLNKKNRFASLSYNDVEAQNRYKQVSIKQMNKEWNVESPNLIPLNNAAFDEIIDMNFIKFIHIARNKNVEADKLANLALNKWGKKPIEETNMQIVDGMQIS